MEYPRVWRPPRKKVGAKKSNFHAFRVAFWFSHLLKKKGICCEKGIIGKAKKVALPPTHSEWVLIVGLASACHSAVVFRPRGVCSRLLSCDLQSDVFSLIKLSRDCSRGLREKKNRQAHKWTQCLFDIWRIFVQIARRRSTGGVISVVKKCCVQHSAELWLLIGHCQTVESPWEYAYRFGWCTFFIQQVVQLNQVVKK